MGITTFTQLEAWQIAHEIVLGVYSTTKRFPKDEQFGLTSQVRKAAVSIAANLAEGFGRCFPRDKIRFYNISQGSLEELRYYVILTRDLGYPAFELDVHRALAKVGGKINRLIASIADTLS